MILYDLVDMKSVQIKKRAQRTAGQDAVHDRSAVSSNISVAETQTDVNTQSMQDGFQLSLAPNQFANETIQRLSTFSEETKAVLAGRTHEVVPNAERMDAAWQAVRERGRDTMMDELLDKPVGEWTPQDHVNAALCSVLAEDAGDLNATVKMAMKYDEAGTNAGQTLQVRKTIEQMTPSGTVAETIRAANRRNEAKGMRLNDLIRLNG